MLYSMTNRVFYIRLQQHSRQYRVGLVNSLIYVNNVSQFIPESQFLETQVGFQILCLAGNRDKRMHRIVQGLANQAGKPCEVGVGAFHIKIEDEGLNRIERIKNEMRVHLGLHRLLLKSSKPGL